MKKLLALLLLLITTVGFASNGNSVKVLVLLANKYGPNYFLNRDAMDEYGWDITLAGLTPEVLDCPFFENVFPITVDSLVSDIKDIMAYDVVALMPASWRSGVPYKDFIEDSLTMAMITTAVDSGLVFWTSCAGVRVLAAADLLQGKNIVGTAKYQDEYAAAGANYLGDDHHPVIDGNIISCVRDQYYYLHNIDAIATALEKSPRHQNGKTISDDFITATASDMVEDDLLWSKTIGGAGADGGKAIVHTADGGFAITGYTYSNSNGYADLLLLKTDAAGNTVWSNTFGSKGWEYGFGLAETADGGFIAAGYTTFDNAGVKDMYLVRTDANGNLVWEKTFGSEGLDAAYSVCVTDENEILVCGYTDFETQGEEDLYLIKTDAQGELIWSKTFGEERSEIGQSVKQAKDGTYMVVGATGSAFNSGNQDVWVLDIDQSGEVIWSKTFGNTSDGFPFDWGKSTCQTASGDWLIAGNSNIVSPMQVYVIKTDSAGNEKWKINYGDTFYDYGNSVCVNDEGSFLVAGATKVPGTLYNDMYLRYFDAQAGELWTKSLGGEFSEWANAVCSTEDGFVILGHTCSMGSGKQDILLTKVTNVVQKMDVLPNTGHAPLEVKFQDQSLGYIDTFEWDFDNDGNVDSNEENPVFTFDTPGYYNVNLKVQGNAFTRTYNFENCVKVFNGESSVNFYNDYSYASCTATDELNFTNTLTFEAWIKPLGYGVFEFGRILDKLNFTFHLNGDMAGLNKRSLVFFQKNNDGTLCSTDTKENTIVLDEWQHVAVTYDALTSTPRLFINGVDQEIEYFYGSPNGAIFDNKNYDLTIGNSADHSLAFDGLIDEVRVWDRVRSEQEIQDTMYDFVDANSEGLVGYWQMNEGNGLEIADLTAYSHNAILRNILWESGVDVLTSIHEHGQGMSTFPQQYELQQNYPNPFNPVTNIHFAIPKASFVKMDVYDIQGRLVRRLADVLQMEAGYHTAVWDGTNALGQTVSTGVYFYRIQTREFVQTKKMIFIR